MALAMREKRKVASEIAKRYQQAPKKEKGAMLNEFCKLTGYMRYYASYLLRNWEKKIKLNLKGERLVIVLSEQRKAKRSRL